MKRENNANVSLDINKIIDANNDNYLEDTKSICEDIIKSNIIYVDSVTSTCLDNIKGINVNSNYIDNVKSTYIVIIKSTNVNNNYLDSIKSTCADRIRK